jgi:CubicO group peptidase (beta-lactamase class C family)
MGPAVPLVRLAAACVAVLASLRALEVPEALRPVRDLAAERVAQGVTPSLAVAVVSKEKALWVEAFGLADVASKRAATIDTPYLLASVTKPITATGLMLLVAEGKLDLDKPVNDYLTKSKLRVPLGSPNDLTLRRLADHTAGMPEHWSFFYGTTPPTMDETIRRYGFAAAVPGTTWSYSNLAYGVLQHVTELTAGKQWTAFLIDSVFDPLGMTHSSVIEVRACCAGKAATIYRKDAAGRFVAIPSYGFDHPGASAAWSSASDLARFLRFHLGDGELDGKRLLPAAAARAMRQPTAATPALRRYGIGWFAGKQQGRTAFWHSGGMPGVATLLRGYPDDGVGIVVLSNSTGHKACVELADRVAAALLPAKEAEPREAPADRPETGTQDPLGAWRGTLVHHQGDLEIALRQGEPRGILVKLGTGPEVTLGDVRWNGRELFGRWSGWLATQDGYAGPMRLELKLERRDDVMTGVCTARADSVHALPHWVELRPAR